VLNTIRSELDHHQERGVEGRRLDHHQERGVEGRRLDHHQERGVEGSRRGAACDRII
jgi:hypothetical protein